ncbi:class I SAM-dependent DNA methyltransferase [Actinoplanes auranticolor]|uniref:Methyltransferase n=1 Tax=Actinoplanes auranticolor TaxID=47988 RepID=A0A919SUD9_9ACTN|nr:class I SAM-dependent methyltransferase [Actinoplanes auranticolor]GIM77228.1 methyltransferase [Actinoplanes auranticolor]
MSTPLGYFQQMYADSPDPWSFDSRWYDNRKHGLTVAALPHARYRSAFEPGCSTGALTARLAPRCAALLAVDAVESAVATAAHRLAAQPHVTVAQARMPYEWPRQTFDLIVLSELGYYFDDTDLDALIAQTVAALEPGGDLVAVHWRRPVAEHARPGEEVHARLDATPGLALTAQHVEADFLLEVYARTPPAPRSVAEREGLC